MTLIYMKQPPLWTKSNLVSMSLWLRAAIQYFDTPLHSRCLRSAFLLFIYYMTSGRQHTLHYLNRFVPFPSRSISQISCSLLSILPYPLQSIPFFVSITHTRQSRHTFLLKNPVKNHVWSQPCAANLHFENNGNEGFSCELQHRQAPWEAVPEMNHDLKRSSSKENYGLD